MIYIENKLRAIKDFGLNTIESVDFSSSPSVLLPSNTQINGSPVVTNATAQAASQFPWRGQWLTSTSYAPNDCVQQAGNGYVCMTTHVSGTFATDLAASKWTLLVSIGTTGLTGPTGPIGPTGTNIDLLYGTSTTGPDGAADGTLYVTYIP